MTESSWTYDRVKGVILPAIAKKSSMRYDLSTVSPWCTSHRAVTVRLNNFGVNPNRRITSQLYVFCYPKAALNHKQDVLFGSIRSPSAPIMLSKPSNLLVRYGKPIRMKRTPSLVVVWCSRSNVIATSKNPYHLLGLHTRKLCLETSSPTGSWPSELLF